MVFIKKNFTKIKIVAYVINLHDHKSIVIHWAALYVNSENVTFFDSFGVEHIPTEIKQFIRNKNIIRNIYRIQAYNSAIWEFFCTRFIKFVLKDKSLLDSTKSFSPDAYEKNDKKNIRKFSITKKMKKLYCVFDCRYRKFGKPKIL